MLKSCDIRGISSIVSRRQECKRWLSSVQDVPIVIVGGGPSGLMMSNLLSSYSTPSVLLEAQTTESRFQHPQAHFLNTRTMEIMRHELPRLVREAMTDIENWRYFQFGYSCTTGIMARVVHPLLFPELELGFVYGKSISPASWQEDTKPHKIVPPVVASPL